MAPKPDAFLSYTRFDDQEGEISEFRTRLSYTVQRVSGEPFVIFQDVDDEKGIALGQKWKGVLHEMLDQARFFIPVLTPSFFNSQNCRDEFETFLELEQKAGRDDLVLPIYYIECPVLEDPELLADDPLASAIDDRHRWDWRELIFEPLTSKEAQKALHALAKQIARARRQRFTVIETPQQVAAGGRSTAKLEVVEPPKAPSRTEPARPKQTRRSQTSKQKRTSSPIPAAGTAFRDIEEPWCPEMVVIPAGRFMMGSATQHEVTFAQPFALGRFSVTFEEYDHFCEQVGRDKPDDREWSRGRRPVIVVSWEDAQAYCQWLSETTGQSYRLLSEAEWEYACRAGTTTAYAFGDEITSEQANFGRNVGKTTEVGSYAANAWGLHDMHGNVWEWVEDCWNDSYEGAPTDGSPWLQGDCSVRVVRGGSWDLVPEFLRSACRVRSQPGSRSNRLGFRVARALTP